MTAAPTVDDVTTRFRAGAYADAAEVAEAVLSAAVSEQRAYQVIDALFRAPALQPLFADRADAARALPFYRWLVAAMESLAGHHAECVAFAQARLAAAFAVADDAEGTARTLAEMFARGREAAALKPPPAVAPNASTPTPTPMAFPVPMPSGVTEEMDVPPPQPSPKGEGATRSPPPPTAPPPTPTPTPTTTPPTPTLCAHLQPVLDYAASRGGTLVAAVRTESTWIYLDHVVLYVANLVDRFGLPESVIIHTELDTGPRPAHGLRCTEHGDAILGAHPLRGAKMTIVG